ncbi:MAG: PD-(D/E)XK nuclease family protein [Clostridium sp.]
MKSIGCEIINPNNNVNIYREYYGRKNEKNNFIDIVIVEKDNENNIKQVICIENKVFSSEGYKQTERYWNIIQDEFATCNCKIEFRYLTKHNFPVTLSNSNFVHYRYSDLASFLKKYSTNKIVSDFYETYIVEDEEKLNKLESLTFEDYLKNFKNNDLQKELCFYVTEKLINNSREIFCDISNSAKGGDIFYKAWKQSWNKTIDGTDFNVHIEAYGEKLYVHFETLPYIPYKKLDKKTKDFMDGQKEIFRRKLESLKDIEGIEKQPIRANATLTIGNFKVKENSFEKYYKTIKDLINNLDPIISKL